MGPRRGGRRPGARREQGNRDSRGPKTSAVPRGKKTQEELDAEMADYFGGNGEAAPAKAEAEGVPSGAGAEDDVDMIE